MPVFLSLSVAKGGLKGYGRKDAEAKELQTTMKKRISWLWFFIFAVALFAMMLGWLLFTPSGAHLAVRHVISHVFGAEDYSIGKMEGFLFGHLTVKDLEIRRFRGRLSSGPAARISKADIFFTAPSLKGLNVEVHNGRLILPDAGCVVIDGVYQDGVFEGEIFGRDIYVTDLPAFFQSRAKELEGFSGRINRLECRLKVSRRTWDIRGKARVTNISGSRFVLEDCPFGFQAESSGSGLSAAVNIYGGRLTLPHVSVLLKPGRLSLAAKDPQDLRFDLKGVAQVEDIAIGIYLRGTLKEPKIRLDSDTSFSQERLLVMLLTGRSWRSAEESLSRGGVSADLIKDALDFLFFGGKATELARLLGVSEVHLEIDQDKKGFGLGAQVTARARLNYTVSQQECPTGNVSVTQKTALVYRVADHLSVEGEKEMRSEQTITNTTQLPEPNDAVFLKYKQNF
ncbi:MAG: translocation/assembly module TamB domain-containing protein [Candidatus Omnitrophica bacterium]|nr:translocation/assembly module TamB domain-containing protein [Candidatus Omnitrophota bacterium]